MGVYDTIMAVCPECGTKNYFQSKSGNCNLKTYDLKDAPIEVLVDANRHAPSTCSGCTSTLYINREERKLITLDSNQKKDILAMNFSESVNSQLEECTRVEVIDENGRSYVNWKRDNKVSVSIQDQKRTLKIFITKRGQ